MQRAEDLTLRLFSNWELMRVIMPSVAMYDRRLSTWVTPERSMRKRRIVQLPVLMALSMPSVIVSGRMHLLMSNWPRFLPSALSAYAAHFNVNATAFCSLTHYSI